MSLADVAPSPQEAFGPFVALCLCAVVVVAIAGLVFFLVKRSKKP
ncbi:hypothetical protein F4553_002271 [Allocatelliglobosispora scoriae]|uniref:Uncharacterized protein n=1 Tax=Allocatelliglobosispora scoriae TaxID=643052 RepID=A0A841BQ56_9ACTN|nr:hypothetical protein [Allocatelliglobosispora scoriae]MBB5868892.1 hypothetical protein [Allocatelliglobosispora scoriae]